ncbi:hypothetical protein BDZ91DRAFT_764184 [Kalaharituber pfeilii]|nr:hypothetical protein BDZ91DRAFT_764184 [Kalaharituber pfeilii]
MQVFGKPSLLRETVAKLPGSLGFLMMEKSLSYCRCSIFYISGNKILGLGTHAERRQRDHMHQLALHNKQGEFHREAEIRREERQERAEERQERVEERRLQREWDRWKLEMERDLEMKRLEVELARLQHQRAPSSPPSRPRTPAERPEQGVAVEVEPTPGPSASRKDVGGGKGKQVAKKPDWKN